MTITLHIPVIGAFGLLYTQTDQKPISSGTSLATAEKIIPGGTPFNFCPESRDTDLFQISSVIVDRMPVHMFVPILYFSWPSWVRSDDLMTCPNSDDFFTVYLEGEFLDTFAPNATLSITSNCGSYCDAYNITDPEDRKGETDTEDFCDLNSLEQPLGHHGNRDCPPQKGPAIISALGYAIPMFIWWPGHYNFTFDAKTKGGRRIYCLTAEVCMRWEDEEKNKRYTLLPIQNCTWPKPREVVS
ncbi:hypothetical protein LIA77_01852 [Sarocladium implicatum]|nr:hypothetical protein LIA77_01852 [Sarocladium implicatum]